MKNRNLPFGYCYENGVCVVHSDEAAVLKRIVRSYLDGQSLRKIASTLNQEQVEYMPGITGWNQARIMRMLEDRRYLGEGGYPTLIDAATHSTLCARKSARNNLKDTNRQADIFKLSTPVLCPDCGAKMRRRHDSRCKCPERWTCENPSCRTLIEIADGELLRQVTERLNRVIVHPELLLAPSTDQAEPNMELRKLENEIGRELDSGSFDTKALQKKMLECVSLKYKSIPAKYNMTNRLRAEFEQSTPLVAFSADMLNRTAEAIQLHRGGDVRLVLQNGQIIEKE